MGLEIARRGVGSLPLMQIMYRMHSSRSLGRRKS